MLDRLIAVFDEADIRPEIKDELWNAIGINVEINLPAHTCLPASLITPITIIVRLIKKNFTRTTAGCKANPG